MKKQNIIKVAKKITLKPKTLHELSVATGLDSATVKDAVQYLRMNGVAICSGNRGFWKWNGKDDSWKHTIARFNRQCETLTATRDAMVEASAKGLVTIDEVLRSL